MHVNWLDCFGYVFCSGNYQPAEQYPVYASEKPASSLVELFKSMHIDEEEAAPVENGDLDHEVQSANWVNRLLNWKLGKLILIWVMYLQFFMQINTLGTTKIAKK